MEEERARRRLEQRRKQVRIGKSTAEYAAVAAVPNRPCTPDPRARVSKRGFDGLVRQWRQELHKVADTAGKKEDRKI